MFDVELRERVRMHTLNPRHDMQHFMGESAIVFLP